MATVLVVDDEPAIISLLVDLVEEAGHTAIAATNGHEAFVLAQQHQPSLIISDVRMPMMDGYELLRALRADPVLTHTMVVLISAQATSAEMYRSTATAFAPKPLDLDLIDSFLHRLV